MNSARKQVAVVVGATSKWQSDGRNTKLAHGKVLDDSDIPVGMRWGVGGAIAQKFAKEGFFVVLTTRSPANASALEKAIIEQGGEGMIVELDLVSRESISRAFATIRKQVGDPDVLVYNAGYLEGRDLPPEKELLEHIPIDIFETAQHRSEEHTSELQSPCNLVCRLLLEKKKKKTKKKYAQSLSQNNREIKYMRHMED